MTGSPHSSRFIQVRAGSQVLITRPVEFYSCPLHSFLNVKTTPAFLNKSSGLDAGTTSGLASTIKLF